MMAVNKKATEPRVPSGLVEVIHLTVTIQFLFPRSGFTAGCLSRATRRVPLVGQELVTLLEHASSLQVLVVFQLF